MYERFISSSMLTGILLCAGVLMKNAGLRDQAFRDRGCTRPQSYTPLDVEISDVERVFLDELAPRLDLVAHQGREHLVRLGVVLGADLEERPVFRVHGGRPQRVRVHLAESLVAVDG